MGLDIFRSAFFRGLHFRLNFLPFAVEPASVPNRLRNCSTIVWASSVWTANTSFKSRVKFSDQSSSPVSARAESSSDPHLVAGLAHASFD